MRPRSEYADCSERITTGGRARPFHHLNPLSHSHPDPLYTHLTCKYDIK